jgi:hypothetical protein
MSVRAFGPVVQHRVGQQLQHRTDLAAFPRQQRQCGGQTRAGAGAADGDACGVDVGLAGEPAQRGVAVLQRRRKRVLGCEPVFHRGNDDVELIGDPAAKAAVLRRVTEHHSAAVDPQQRRRPGRSRPEDVY